MAVWQSEGRKSALNSIKPRRFQNHEMEYDRSVVGRCRLCWLAAGACVGVSEGVRAWTLSAEAACMMR